MVRNNFSPQDTNRVYSSGCANGTANGTARDLPVDLPVAATGANKLALSEPKRPEDYGMIIANFDASTDREHNMYMTTIQRERILAELSKNMLAELSDHSQDALEETATRYDEILHACPVKKWINLSIRNT
jgi:hypothetical protein